jgi:hypothetical protein
MARIHRPKWDTNPHLVYPHDKPPAAPGCVVLVQRDGLRCLARVKSFRDNVYTLTAHADAGQEKRSSLEEIQRSSTERGAEALQHVINGPKPETQTWTIALTADGPADRWRDAVCDDCVVCSAHPFNVALECRCSVPCVCAQCAADLDRCPQCRATVNKDRWLRNYGEGNLFSIETAFDLRPVQLFVRSLLGQTWTIESFLEWRITDFKRAFLTKTGVPVNQQRLLCGGLQLDDDGFALRAYGVERDTTFHIVLRLTGDKIHLLASAVCSLLAHPSFACGIKNSIRAMVPFVLPDQMNGATKRCTAPSLPLLQLGHT